MQKNPFRLTLTLALALSFPAIITSQEQARPLPDRWRALVLDQSTPEDAIKLFGPPSSDKLGSLQVFRIQKWLTKKTKEKVFRTLEYKKPEGIDKARFLFLNNKLVAIDLDVKKGITPGALSNIYGIEFRPLVGSVDIAFNPRDYEQNQGRVYPKTYPIVYSMVAVSERSFIAATIGNDPSFLGAFAKSAGIPDDPNSFPGKVERVTLISRTLENRDGADVLQ